MSLFKRHTISKTPTGRPVVRDSEVEINESKGVSSYGEDKPRHSEQAKQIKVKEVNLKREARKQRVLAFLEANPDIPLTYEDIAQGARLKYVKSASMYVRELIAERKIARTRVSLSGGVLTFQYRKPTRGPKVGIGETLKKHPELQRRRIAGLKERGRNIQQQRKRQLLSILKQTEGKPVKTAKLAKSMGVSGVTVSRYIRELVGEGKISQENPGRGRRQGRWVYTVLVPVEPELVAKADKLVSRSQKVLNAIANNFGRPLPYLEISSQSGVAVGTLTRIVDSLVANGQIVYGKNKPRVYSPGERFNGAVSEVTGMLPQPVEHFRVPVQSLSNLEQLVFQYIRETKDVHALDFYEWVERKGK